MAKQTETNVPHPTTIQFTAMYSFVKIGTNPPNTIAVNTSLDKSKKYFAKVSFTVLSQLRASFFSSCCLLKFPIAKLVIFLLLHHPLVHLDEAFLLCEQSFERLDALLKHGIGLDGRICCEIMSCAIASYCHTAIISSYAITFI